MIDDDADNHNDDDNDNRNDDDDHHNHNDNDDDDCSLFGSFLLSRLVCVQVEPVEHGKSLLGVPVLNIIIIVWWELYRDDCMMISRWYGDDRAQASFPTIYYIFLRYSPFNGWL